MFKTSSVYKLFFICFVGFYTSSVYSKEYLLEANIDARGDYDDNIFLTPFSHDSVTGTIITPVLKAIVKEEHWLTELDAKLRKKSYSDSALNSNDKYFNLLGRYAMERNIFSLNANYDLSSNLSSSSTDFGIASVRVKSTRQSITPAYTRLLTERLTFTLSYSYSDVGYENVENTNFTPYITQTGSTSIIYNLTEKDRLTYSLQAVDYESKNQLVTYRLFVSNLGIAHELSETLSMNFSIGISRRNSTSRVVQAFDFLGQPIVQTQEIDFGSRGLVYNAGMSQLLESGEVSGQFSRNDVTNSTGGLNQIDSFIIDYGSEITSLWGYVLKGRYESIVAVTSSGTSGSDRDVFFFESIVHRSLSRNWKVNASYRYIVRKFKNDTSGDKAPDSNRLYIGLTYNFPSLSTF